MLNLPNALTSLRIVLLPVFVVTFFLLPDQPYWAVLVLAVSGLTDLFDGYFARKLNQITRLGIVLDPLADKLTQAMVTGCIAIRYPEYWVVFGAIVLREVLMLIGYVTVVRGGSGFQPARWFGKVYTFAFYLIMLVVLLFPSLPDLVRILLMCLVLGLLLFAMGMYIPLFFQLVRQGKTPAGGVAGEKSATEE